MTSPRDVCVVVPCFRCRKHVLSVLSAIPQTIRWIVCVDDACPEDSGAYIEENCRDPRVEVIRNRRNLGVGGATMAGYRRAVELGAAVVVKIDSDGQMDPSQVSRFVDPILRGEADYTKGNRFYNPDSLRAMPGIRLFGNAVLSFFSKLSSGYWNLMDPTNGYTAVAAPLLTRLPLERIDNGYFFESDMLFRLATFRAVVLDVPMEAAYGDEESNLSVGRELFRFLGLHVHRFAKRIFYNYYLRNFNVASLQLVFGVLLTLSGLVMGYVEHAHHAALGQPTPTGLIAIVLLQLLIGLEMLLAFINYDVAQVPAQPIAGMLATDVAPGSR